RSDTCGHCPSPSSSMAFNQSSFLPGRSKETPNTVKFLSLNLLKAATTFGFSWRQGPHQLAQKSTNTYLPRNDDNDRLFPAVSGSVKSGANAPTASFSMLAIFSPKSFPSGVDFKFDDKASYAGFAKDDTLS